MKQTHAEKKAKGRNVFLALAMVFLLLVLASCSSISNLVRSSVEGVPSWVYQPEAKVNQIVFVGKGNANVMFNARLIAYEDILNQLSTFVGEDVLEAYYRELTTTDSIVDLGLKITHEYEKVDQNGSNAYLMATAETAKIVSKRTDVFNAMLERDSAIAGFIADAETAYRSNKDVEAVRLYLQAAAESSTGLVSDKKYEVDALLEKAESIIASMRFSIAKSDSSKATCTVYLRRKSRLLSPKVSNAPIKASFSARNSLGRNYTDSLLFNTAANGYITFLPYNKGIAGSGTIIFGIDLDDSLSFLQEVLTSEQMQRLKDVILENRVSFAYSLVSPLQASGIFADIHEYSSQGELLPSHVATEAMCNEFSIDSIYVEPTYVVSSEGKELISEIGKLGKDAKFFMLGRVGVVDEQLFGQKNTVVVSGTVQLWNLESGKILGDTLDIEAVAFDNDLSKARDEAFRKFGMISSYLLSQYLF
ncbi:hypothetical protein SpiGrapes_2491 [Sphaerochaeta pleomorpha str. Grapes]|uniref:Uncharacterized protein n=1 Tax=Sphaerochaeta pleomorpha (strain ATCC BAA-1885 / DSM 22778 / Grapes) TaxID=158190 RepID=G8QU05_SPHPG|nr:hypothetical protein [Sphaerochaeta pleomorpha]AEV30252.1 hypothetical protein SpiGrapes_2491 [Sphaerochaeta pleomorpha str. Grapes]